MRASVSMVGESSQRRPGRVTGVMRATTACKLHVIGRASNTPVRIDPSTSVPEILVIDDDAIMRDLVADWLEAAGYQVRKATSCGSWIGQLLGRQSPRVIVTDMFMPGPCG